MAASNRRDPITIQNLKTGVNPGELGEPNNVDPNNWQSYFPCMAEVIVKGTRDFVRAGMQEAECSHIIRVPYSPETLAVTPTNFQIVLQVTGEVLHIKEAYRRSQMNTEIEILCVN